jgi:hypothetical protein
MLKCYNAIAYSETDTRGYNVYLSRGYNVYLSVV